MSLTVPLGDTDCEAEPESLVVLDTLAVREEVPQCVGEMLPEEVALPEKVPLGVMEGLLVVETVEVCDAVRHSVGLVLKVEEWQGDTDCESVSDLLWETLTV